MMWNVCVTTSAVLIFGSAERPHCQAATVTAIGKRARDGIFVNTSWPSFTIAGPATTKNETGNRASEVATSGTAPFPARTSLKGENVIVCRVPDVLHRALTSTATG